MANNKRDITKLLPAYLQTRDLTKLFSATANHLFQETDVDFLSSYIGSQPAWYNPQTDFYISEPDAFRTNYQLSPTAVSINSLSGQITQALFYEDLINSLRFQGALVNNHNRLFSAEYYSWSPPIDIDKFVNFSNYFWLPNGPSTIVLLDQTDLINTCIGKSSYIYTGAYQFFNGTIVSGSLTFTSGLNITLTNDLTLSLNNIQYYVEGVGQSIQLVNVSNDNTSPWDVKPWDTTGWDGEEIQSSQYVTIARGSLDDNQWSQSNKWFHIDVINLSNTTLSDPAQIQAARPIIEFIPGIVLYQYGTTNRGIIDIIDTTDVNFLGTLVGKVNYSINGIQLQNGMLILPIVDTHSNVNNIIYQVSGVGLAIELTPIANGSDTTGAPQLNDRVNIRFGPYEGYNAYYNGSFWILTGQQKTNNPPLFELYDIDGNPMDDPSVYLNSTFTGSTVFAYEISTTSPFDTVLGINAAPDEFGDFIFNNSIATTVVNYTSNLQTVQYYGDMFFNVITSSSNQYLSDWYTAPTTSRQYIINEFNISTTTYSVEIDQIPAIQEFNTLPNIIINIDNADFTSSLLVNGTDYQVMGQTVVFTQPLVAGQRAIIQSWNSESPTTLTGYYELPLNLTANPNNLPVTTVSRGQFLQQFTQILQNQTGFSGQALGVNNYRDTYKEKGLGLSILQHRAPLIKTCLLNTTPFSNLNLNSSYIDPMLSMQYAERSYQRFYSRFIQTLFLQVAKAGVLPTNMPNGCDPYNVNQLLASALTQVNLGKSAASPWVNSGPDGVQGRYTFAPSTAPTYVPPTATRLGIAPAFLPMVYIDPTRTGSPLVIQTHNGSRIVMVDQSGNQLGTILHNQTSTTNPEQLTNPIAAAWLQFENNLFNCMPTEYSNSEAKLVFDTRTYSPGKWRSSDYSMDEFIRLERAPFDKWVITNQVDYESNTTFNIRNQFTFNYSSVNDRQGYPVPGYWQGIYRWFYDTDRPNTHPWEMLGFSQMPPWWTSQYGPAPYASGNTALWEDLTNGIIRQGPRAGTYAAWARPGLMACIPVDSQGNLLPPFLAGTVSSIPSVSEASANWIFGDGGPIESAWVYSQDYNFVLAEVGYLMKPAAFIEYTWDILRTQQVFSNEIDNQWVYIDTNSRRSSAQFYVHRENPASMNTTTFIPNESTLTYFGSGGIQHWISEYVISQNLNVTRYFGTIIRGGDVQLAHRMAGFVATDTFRGLADSFGQIGYSSRLIPTENINIYLYQSSSLNEVFYSGIIVEQTANNTWNVYGYDAINPYFTIIPSNTTGTRSTVVIGNQRVIEYAAGLNDTTQTIPYGTTFNTYQEVYDFVISYGRWLTSQGWLFDEFNQTSNTVSDWSSSAKEYLFWAQGNWTNGTFITVSPSASTITFSQQYGNIQYVNGIVAGTYPILDRAGAPIQPQNVVVNRIGDTITLTTTNGQGIYGLRLFSTTIEHAVFFDNTTAFNDVVYAPLYNLQQQRILIYCYRANQWDGRVDIPGYFLAQNTSTNTWVMTSNFEKTVSDITKYFNIDEPKTYTQINPVTNVVTISQSTLANLDRQDISLLAKHLIAYQPRTYLQDLLLEDATEFEFYQGFIKQKGTLAAVNALFRNTAILPAGSTFEYFDEWLLRAGYYGATTLNNTVQFILPQARIVSNPQWIRLFSQNFSDIPGQAVLDIVPHDPLIVNPPENYPTALFQTRKFYQQDFKSDLPSAGYALLGDTDYYVVDTEELLSLYSTQLNTLSPLQPGNTVWQFIVDVSGGNLNLPTQYVNQWVIWILTPAYGQVATTISSIDTGNLTYITTTQPHGLLPGDVCVIFGVGGVPTISGTYQIFNVTPSSFQIRLTTYNIGSGGTIWVYRPMRFQNTFQRDSNEIPIGWQEGNLVYVDNGGVVNNAWTVYRYHNGEWIQFRQQNLQIAPSLIGPTLLVNSVNNTQIIGINYFDPAKGRISGQADAEIAFKTDYDPALYNNGGNTSGFSVTTGEAWNSSKLGLVWWDLSTVRYIDYEQGDETYRVQQWGKIAPGTSVDVYEWIRSSISPTSWASAVATGTAITDGNNTFIPSGTVKNPTSPNWTQTLEYNSNGIQTTFYYFWVGNSTMAPQVPTRQYNTLALSNMISNPNFTGIPWWAAISPRSLIVSGVQQYLNDNQIIMEIDYTTQENNKNIYSQWQLVRDGDPFSPITDFFWNKMKDSLVGSVIRGSETGPGIGDDVPDYTLNPLNMFGTDIRPRQTWFVDRVAASALFIQTFNNLLATATTPLIDDASMITWVDYFNLNEPEPSQAGNWNYHVADLNQRNALVGVISPGQTVLVDPLSLTGNVWTIWQYSSISSNWTLVRQQTYNTANYWEYIDWYAAGYGPTTIINYTVDTVTDLNLLSPAVNGTVAEVSNNGNNKWQLYVYNNGWVLVGYQDATIQILSSVYDWTTAFGGFDGQPLDSSPFDQTAAIEFANIIDGIKNAIYATPNSIELNTLFFAMINYVVAEQVYVDWIFKTSNIVLKGFNEPLSQPPLLPPDYTTSILGFIAEAKPYHAKVREFIVGKTAMDIAGMAVSDFDVPPGYLGDTMAPTGASGGIDINPAYAQGPDTVLFSNVVVQGAEGYAFNNTFASWYNNYQTNPSLIRQLSITMLFDRVASSQGITGWGIVWDTVPWDFAETDSSSGAYYRIFEDYMPQPGMPPRDINALIGGAEYRGIILGGMNLNLGVGWGIAPWDSPIGWDARQSDIDAYLDIIVQGGFIPKYDTAIGNGSTTTFPLTIGTSNPNDMVVWSDGQLRKYGIDWTVPVSIDTITVVDGGNGLYLPGQTLQIISGSSIIPATVIITGISNEQVTDVSIVSNGIFNTVTNGPYQCRYPLASPGSGSGLLLNIIWNCTQIVFTVPPANSLTPNIYILYAGTTFEAAPTSMSDTIFEGYQFIQPNVDDNHPEELFPFTVKNGLRLDVMQSSAGGRPLVYNSVYQTDGNKAIFNLPILPQSDAAIIAYLNGQPLKVSPTHDFVINYFQQTMVFVVAPPPGILSVISISTGGASREIADVFINNYGFGYLPGDVITLSGPHVGNPPTIMITSVAGSNVNIVSGGSSYQIGDKLILSNVNVAIGDLPVVLEVSAANLTTGAITNVSISDIGSISVIPNPTIWETTRINNVNSINANISINWGAFDAMVITSGLYARLPMQPVGQITVPNSGGMGAEWLIEFTGDSQLYSFQENSQTSYTLPNVGNITASQLFVNVNGNVISNINVMTSNGSAIVTLPNVPPYGSTIQITEFDNNLFSVVTDTEIVISNANVLTYSIAPGPANTVPNYLTTLVRKNGNLMTPPTMELLVGDGLRNSFNVNISLSGNTFVYVDQILNGINSNIVGNTITFNTAPEFNADIQLLVINANTQYFINGNNITFNSNVISNSDNVIVTTYQQDIDYEYHIDEFTGNSTYLYPLAKEPYDVSSIVVWLNNTLLIPQYNYTTPIVQINDGWDTHPWDTTGWDNDTHSTVGIQIASELTYSTDKIVVSYMTGLPHKPAISWRTIISQGKSLSIALDPARITILLSNVYTNGNTIEIADYTSLTTPSSHNLGAIWINNELIYFTQIQFAPTVSYPNRAFLAGLQRNRMGTSGTPTDTYTSLFYSGNNSTVYFPAEAVNSVINTSVWIDYNIQILGTDYNFVQNPNALPTGNYVVFESPPPIGYRNIRIISLVRDSLNNFVSHIVGSEVIDAGEQVQFNYQWQSAKFGLQYNETPMSEFLLDHALIGS